VNTSVEPQGSEDDISHMRAALSLARRGLGNVWPNPAVGCVLVNRRRIIGRGWTQPGGRPHAEMEALRCAGADARGATAYITLEPCSHHGETAPCSEALIASGIHRAVIAVGDPDPRVSGRGEACLRASAVAVTTNVLRGAAAEINAGFFLKVTQGRPLITLKTATTLDGRIATSSGDSQWITGEDARTVGQRLRAEHDAVLIGSGTAMADDPALTCRLPGMEGRSPLRIVLDGRLRLSTSAKLVKTARQTPTWVVTSADANAERRMELEASGVRVIKIDAGPAEHPKPEAVVTELARFGVTRVLVEGGGEIAASFLAAGLVDRIAWFRGPRIIGGDGIPAAASMGVEKLAGAPTFSRTSVNVVAADLLEVYERVR
jgi:diaminohydroxyphosphoribosylaminopyrimidine deaminase/5-amino-6-(5-phosphoribosylamino)uracil reductase